MQHVLRVQSYSILKKQQSLHPHYFHAFPHKTLNNEEKHIINGTTIAHIQKIITIFATQNNGLNTTRRDQPAIISSPLTYTKQHINKPTRDINTENNLTEEKIKEDLKQRLDEIDENINEIFKNSTGLVEEYVVKLRKRIQEILNTDVVDETRLAQEIVIYSDKTSIEEEITRIKSHIIQFKELLNSEGAIGKKADFIIQEMNREINTIGSKSGKFEITQLVIKIKTQIEDIREQIQNIE